MRAKKVRHFIIGLFCLFHIAIAAATEEEKPGGVEEEKPWGVTLFIAQGANASVQGIYKKGESVYVSFKNTYFVSVELMRQIYCWEKIFFLNNVSLEIESQIAKHWGRQHNGELTICPLLRFNTITWPEVISMNFAIGDGISQALGNPKFERVQVKRLNFFMIEGAFFLPEKPDLQMVLRWHHRCKCWGAFSNNCRTGSEFFALGLRYRF